MKKTFSIFALLLVSAAISFSQVSFTVVKKGNVNIGVNVPADQSSFEDYTSEKVAAAATEATSFITNQLQAGEVLSFYAEIFEDDGTPSGEKIQATINKDTIDFINTAVGVQPQ